MNGCKRLRIEQLRIERHLRAKIGILFRRGDFAVNHKNNFRRHPATTELLILVELRLLRLRAVATRGAQHAHEVKILLIDPKLRRMEIAWLRADDIDRSSL